MLKFTFFQAFCIFRYNQMVDAILDFSVHEGTEVVDGIVDAMVGDASLWVVVSTNLGRTVASTIPSTTSVPSWTEKSRIASTI